MGKKTEYIFSRGHSSCQHNKFIVDRELDRVKCGLCGEYLSPIWVLEQMCSREERANMRIVQLNKIAEKAQAKNRCKCESCGKMTRIQK
ncbi:MAG: hypothetical protein GY800_04130 [Planctomycetes bacterium]|nr:hypothetical protein [Planctomycetota bacterium]